MDAPTVARLNALNREFYRRHALSFDRTRRAPWPGWQRVAELVSSLDRPSILDVGCGNARFGLFLASAESRPIDSLDIDYVGIDASPRLLAIAASRGPSHWRWVEADVIAEPLPLVGEFDLVVCFGVLHHVPGESTRQALLSSLAERLAQGGHLAVSFWQFGDRARFRDRALGWRSGVRGPESLDLSKLEHNDFLLPWGADSGSAQGELPIRYCHFVDRAEARRLVGELRVEKPGLEPVDEFVADGHSGDLNLYHLLRRP